MTTLAQERPLNMRRHRLTVDAYDRMFEIGVFGPEAKVELIDGEVIEMNTVGTRHASTVKRLNALLGAAVGTLGTVSIQDPLRLGTDSEPQPDVVLAKPRADFYADAHPTADDALLVIEVADTSVRYDREIKLPLYARHGVCEVWIVDLDARLVRFHRRPRGNEYVDITATETPGPTPIGALPGVMVDLSGLLPPA